ncbi:hypothetical protein IH970_01465 [candidate division KSB1 bacterium]|nr:hypothetical protein [candidate division KSB1 bacterium]
MIRPFGTIITILFAIIITVSFAGSTFAKEIGTIILKSGHEYQNVEYEFSEFLKRVTIFETGKMFRISLKKIDSILDKDGTVVYPQILTKEMVSQKSVSSTQDTKFTKTNKIWDFAFNFGYTYNFHSGDYYQGISNSNGFDIGIRISLSKSAALKFDFSYFSMNLNDELLSELEQISNNSPINFSQDLNGSSIMIFFEYFGGSIRNHSFTNLSYLNLGIGRTTNHFDFKSEFWLSPDSKTVKIASFNDSRYLFSLGAGFIIGIKDNIGIDVGIDYDSLLLRFGFAKNDIIGNVLNLKLGIIKFTK